MIDPKKPSNERLVIVHESPSTTRPRVLFMPGAYSDAKISNYLLQSLGWSQIFDLVMVDATYDTSPLSTLLQENIHRFDEAFAPLVERGLYDPNDTHTTWQAGIDKLFRHYNGERASISTTKTATPSCTTQPPTFQ